MADVIHQQGGLWIAPAAPGFDARLIGGTRVVERQAGATLRREFAAALQSEPDAIGLISWNEFSENSHIEPSCLHGGATLTVVASLLDGVAPANTGCRQAAAPQEFAAADATPIPSATAIATPVSETERQQLAKFGFDSSNGSASNLRSGNLVLLGGFGVFVIGSITIVARRARKDARDGGLS